MRRVKRYAVAIAIFVLIGFAIGYGSVWAFSALAHVLGLSSWFVLVPPLVVIASFQVTRLRRTERPR